MNPVEERKRRLVFLESYTQARLADHPEFRGTFLYNMIIDQACLKYQVSRRTAAEYATYVILDLGLQERVKNVGKGVVYQAVAGKGQEGE